MKKTLLMLAVGFTMSFAHADHSDFATHLKNPNQSKKQLTRCEKKKKKCVNSAQRKFKLNKGKNVLISAMSKKRLETELNKCERVHKCKKSAKVKLPKKPKTNVLSAIKSSKKRKITKSKKASKSKRVISGTHQKSAQRGLRLADDREVK